MVDLSTYDRRLILLSIANRLGANLSTDLTLYDERIVLGAINDAVADLPTTYAPLVDVVNVVATSGATETLPDPSVQSVSHVTLTASCTFTLPTPVAGKSFTLVLLQGGTGSYTATLTGVLWAGGTAPTLSTAVGAVDVLTCACTDGVSWMGFAAGLDVR